MDGLRFCRCTRLATRLGAFERALGDREGSASGPLAIAARRAPAACRDVFKVLHSKQIIQSLLLVCRTVPT